MTTPAYYKDNVPYDASGQAIITITGDKPPTPLVTDLGDGNFKFQSQHQACYLKNVTTLGMQWVTDRPDGGIAMCYATPDEEKVAVSLMTGLLAAPVYTPQQAAAATLLLGAAGAMALSSGRWSMQLSLGGVGAATLPGGGVNILAGEILAALEAAVSRAAGLLTASTVGPMVAAAAVMFVSLPAGEGSDRVPGRNQQAMFAMNARLLTGKNVAIGLRSSSVNLPVRGALVERNGQLTLELLKTGNGVSATVQVLNAVRDAATGLDIITLPAVGGMPPRIILVNPVPVPTGPGNTGNQTPVPVTPLHTGTDVKPVENIVVTPPAGDIGELWDFIYWRPNAAGTGVEPIYVMLSSPRDMPGTVSGKGQTVGNNWLGDAGMGDGAPIPSQIADKLRGREFASFDSFRKAVWKAASDNAELKKQFSNQNQGNIENRKSPFVRKSERVGGRKRYELHHVNPISNDGSVYNIDNIRVMTPKRHIETHKEGN